MPVLLRAQAQTRQELWSLALRLVGGVMGDCWSGHAFPLRVQPDGATASGCVVSSDCGSVPSIYSVWVVEGSKAEGPRLQM